MQEYTKEQIAEKLATNNTWLFRAILAIYNKQTDAEQAVGVTREDNGVGFNGVDSVILSSFAKQIKTWEVATGRRFPTPLSPKQITIARAKMKKYAGQLAKIANAGIAAAVQPAPASTLSQEEEEFNSVQEA